MNENENLEPVQKLTPFTKMVMSIGTLPSSFYASMSYYESMVWLYEYLKNEVIPTVNGNAEAVEELQEAFTTLENYISTYFDNLDLQQEVNTKLDQMAEDGTITNLIQQYIDPIFTDYKDSLDGTIDEFIQQTNNSIQGQDEEISTFKTTVNGQINAIDTKVSSAISGTPKGVYATVSDLTTADPNHDYIYLVLADGKWYYYNGANWAAGGVYQSAGIGYGAVEASNLSSSIQNALYIKSPSITWTDGEYFFNNGSYSNVGFCKSNPIQLAKNETIRVKAQGYNQNVNIFTLVTSENVPTQVDRVLCTDSTFKYYEYTAFEDCYISICSTVSNRIDDLIIYKNIDSFKTEFISIDITKNLSSGYMVPNGIVVTQHNSYRKTDYIEMSPNTKYTLYNLNFNSTDNVGLCYYDENKNYIGGLRYTATIDLDFTTLPNTYYVRFTLHKDYLKNLNLISFDNQYDLQYDLNTKLNDIMNRPIGMADNIAMYGDSLTWGLTYTASNEAYRNKFYIPYFLKKMIGNETDHILGFGGAKTDTFWDTYGGYILDSNSLCIIWFGTNDQFTDTVETDCAGNDWTTYASTETGYFGKIIGKCKGNGGNQIVLLTQFADNPYKTTNNKVIHDLANKFGCTVVELDNTEITKEKYHTAYNGFYNAVHFNNLGNNYVANMIVNTLNKKMMNTPMEIYKAR